MLPTNACLMELSETPPPNVQINPYKAKRLWPPDFTKLSPKHQFRLERRYRRRAKLKWARPRWTKAVKLAQWGCSISILTYGVLFMDWGRENTPFQGIRKWFNETKDSIWGAGQPTRPNLGPSSTVTPSASTLQSHNARRAGNGYGSEINPEEHFSGNRRGSSIDGGHARRIEPP